MVKFIRSKADKRRIMKSCHVDTTSGHLGIKKTVARIKERFMWKGIWSDVKEMVCFISMMFHLPQFGL